MKSIRTLIPIIAVVSLVVNAVLVLSPRMKYARCFDDEKPSEYLLQRRSLMVIDSFIVQAQLYTRLKGDFPAGFQDLITPYDGEGRHGPNDAFGRTLKFNVINGKICIRSAGVDGQFMTDDDIIGEGDKEGPGRTIKSPIGFYTVNYDA